VLAKIRISVAFSGAISGCSLYLLLFSIASLLEMTKKAKGCRSHPGYKTAKTSTVFYR
jgi:hypothetical protein